MSYTINSTLNYYFKTKKNRDNIKLLSPDKNIIEIMETDITFLLIFNILKVQKFKIKLS